MDWLKGKDRLSRRANRRIFGLVLALVALIGALGAAAGGELQRNGREIESGYAEQQTLDELQELLDRPWSPDEAPDEGDRGGRDDRWASRDERRVRGREAGEEPYGSDDEPDGGALLDRHDGGSARTGTGTEATAARTASAGSMRCTQNSGASVSLCARAGIDTALMSSGVTKSRPR